MRRLADRGGRTVPALAVCVALLSVWDIVVRPALSSALHPAGGVVVAGCTVAIALWAGLDADGLGLSPRRLPDGLRYGALAFGAVTAVVLVGLAIPATRHSFHTGRADITAGRLLLDVLVTIPLGTVVVEELAFRGALLGLLRQAMPTARAVVACSLLFGLWHVPGGAGRDVRVPEPRAGRGGRDLRGDLRCRHLLLLAAGPVRQPVGAGHGSPGDQHGGPHRRLAGGPLGPATVLAPERRAQSVALHQLGDPGRVHEEAVLARQ